jgi:hypothetical protein
MAVLCLVQGRDARYTNPRQLAGYDNRVIAAMARQRWFTPQARLREGKRQQAARTPKLRSIHGETLMSFASRTRREWVLSGILRPPL